MLASTNVAGTTTALNLHWSVVGWSTKLAPVTVTRVAPWSGPHSGDTPDTTTLGRYRNCSGALPAENSTPLVETRMPTYSGASMDPGLAPTLPDVTGGVTHTSSAPKLADWHSTTDSPKRARTATPSEGTRCLPKMRTVVPPPAVPWEGVMVSSSATGRYANWAALAAGDRSTRLVVTRTECAPTVADGGATHCTAVGAR